MKSNVVVIIFALTAIFGIWKTISLSNELTATKAELAIAQQKIESISEDDDVLSEWDVFTLALMNQTMNLLR